MTKTAFIGIDPGSPVTMALVGYTGKLLAYAGGDQLAVKIGKYNTNVPELFVSILKDWTKAKSGNVEVVIENVGPMPGEGIASATRFVGSLWMAKTAAVSLGLPYHMVAPSPWKKHYGLGPDKELSRVKALQLWPHMAHRFRYKKDHNYAEAALLARYQWEKENGR